MKTKPVITSEEAKAAVLEMRKHFLVPLDLSAMLEQLTQISQHAPGHFKQPIAAFCSALQAVESTCAFPYMLADSKTSALHFQRFLMVERIQNIPSVYDKSEIKKTDDEVEELAYRDARDSFSTFLSSQEGLNLLANEISQTLLDALKNARTASAICELRYQGVVSLWSAFEVVVRDILTLLLNTSPDKCQQLLADQLAKKYFYLPKFSIEDLSSSGYDLSDKMGDLLLGSRDFSDLKAIKAAVNAIAADSDVASALNSTTLWNLNQDRHLIVHRRGVIDAKYIEATGAEVNTGDVLSVTPKQLGEYLTCVISSTTSVISALIQDHG